MLEVMWWAHIFSKNVACSGGAEAVGQTNVKLWRWVAGCGSIDWLGWLQGGHGLGSSGLLTLGGFRPAILTAGLNIASVSWYACQ